MLLVVLVMSSCEKQEIQVNQVNPLDNYLKAIDNVDIDYQNICNDKNIFDNSNNSKSFKKIFDKSLNLSINKLDSIQFVNQVMEMFENSNLPTLDTNITDTELQILSLYFSNIKENNYCSLSNNFENIISSDNNLTLSQKENIFAIIFYAKYTYYFKTELTKDFDTCMDEQLGNIFNNSNYVDDIGFIVGCPISVLCVVAYCVVD